MNYQGFYTKGKISCKFGEKIGRIDKNDLKKIKCRHPLR